MDGATDGRSRYERMLLRIAALLVSLSLLAERAADRSFPVRVLVLAILWRADSIARAFVVRETGTDWPDLETADVRGHPMEAACLALRLRLLAAMLCDLVELGCRSAGCHPFAGIAPRGLAPVMFFIVADHRRQGPVRIRPWDTS